MKIAVMWSRFGPYHVARLRGAARAGTAAGIAVVGIEVARRDAVYAWDVVEKGQDFEHVTLFDRDTYHDIAAAEIERQTIAALERIRPDVIAVNGWSVAEARAAIGWAKRGRRARVIVMSETKADDAPRRWWKELYKRHLLAGCDRALVGGRAHADYLVGLGLPRDGIHLGYDVVDNDHFARGAAAARADAVRRRAEKGLPARYFFACTRFIARKNIDGLLRGFAVYRQTSGDAAWGLVIAGSGEEKAAYDALVRDLAVEGVVWPGFVQYEELPTYYGLAGAFVHPAHAEAWGLVVNEAQAAGLPVIVSRTVGACSELVDDGVNGFCFEPTSPTDLAARLSAVADLGQDRQHAMQEAALTTAAEWTPRRFGVALLAAAAMPHRSAGRQQDGCGPRALPAAATRSSGAP